MCRADYISQCNAADWRKRRRPAPRRDTVETAVCLPGSKCETNSCGVEGPPCQAPAESDDDDCVDDEDWSYVTKEGDEYDCDHVAKKTKRCTTRFSEDGVRADDACKKTCGTCP